MWKGFDMRKMSALEQKIFNEGERLIPGISHNLNEFIRHRNSYMLWRKIIEYDIMYQYITTTPIRIADLGCGVGHGCLTLAEIPNAEVVGIDNSSETIAYAQTYYNQSNIIYQTGNLVDYVQDMPEFDYVVSRGVLEHIPNGLDLAHHSNWRYRLMFDVPYEEPVANPHHILHEINEKDFENFSHIELFYQDLEGILYDAFHKPSKPNMIMAIIRNEHLPSIQDMCFDFPKLIWKPDDNDPLWEWEKEQQLITINSSNISLPKRVLGKIKRIIRELYHRG